LSYGTTKPSAGTWDHTGPREGAPARRISPFATNSGAAHRYKSTPSLSDDDACAPSSARRRIGRALTDHATVLARAEAALARIESAMAWAQRNGVLSEFNREYRRRRLESQRRGERFMGYGQATARLRRAMIKVAATGAVPVAIVHEVFGDVPKVSDSGRYPATWIGPG
jgi:hypothetical protein